MLTDLHGLLLTAPSSAAGAAFNLTVQRYLAYRTDTAMPLFESLAQEPLFAMGQCLKGYLTLLGFKQANVPAAAAALRAARLAAPGVTERETLHLAALQAWVEGRLNQAIAVWEQILRTYPTDLLAFRLVHFNAFWLGRPAVMLASVEQVRPYWNEDLPAWGTMLGCHCFALEECDRHAEAEPHGRAAVALNPADLWSTHAVAHVLEMQGRHEEGIAWLAGLAPHWGAGNNLVHHLWWHRGMMHLGQGDTAAMLDLYDTRFRNLSSPLTQAQPDLYIDLQNAVSALYRLQHLGVDVGGRWRELADHAQARIGDCLSAFTLPHFMMALLADQRFDAAAQMIGAMRAFGAGPDENAPVVAEVAVPLVESMLLAARGRIADALDRVRPVVSRLSELGGSHAQQEVLALFVLRTARAADSGADVRAVLAPIDRRFAGGWRSRPVLVHH